MGRRYISALLLWLGVCGGFRTSFNIPHTGARRMSATPQQIYHSALDQAWRKNVHILNKINKLELLGVIDMYEFEFSRTLEAQATEMLDRKTLWNKAYERDRTQQNTPKRFHELSKFYEKYCNSAESDGKTAESIGDLIDLLAQQCGKLSKAQKSLCDVVIPSDRLDFYMCYFADALCSDLPVPSQMADVSRRGV